MRFVLNIYQSSEDYLETILVLKNRLGAVRSIDIAGELGYSKPSVSVAMKKLRESGYISVDENGFITLLEPGLIIAKKVSQRHETLAEFLIAIGVEEETARADACKIEHDLSDETFLKILQHFEKMK